MFVLQTKNKLVLQTNRFRIHVVPLDFLFGCTLLVLILQNIGDFRPGLGYA